MNNGGYSEVETYYSEFSGGSTSGLERYRGINRCAYSKFKTLEIRISTGSVDADHIVNWCKLLVKVANRPVRKFSHATTVTDLQVFAKRFKLDQNLKSYVTAKVAKMKARHVRSRYTSVIAA